MITVRKSETREMPDWSSPLERVRAPASERTSLRLIASWAATPGSLGLAPATGVGVSRGRSNSRAIAPPTPPKSGISSSGSSTSLPDVTGETSGVSLGAESMGLPPGVGVGAGVGVALEEPTKSLPISRTPATVSQTLYSRLLP